MKQYKNFQPTGFNSKDLALRDQQHWLVLYLIKTRDSELLEKHNFDTALKELKGESKDCEVCLFNHWGCGHFEIILINPENKELVTIAESIESSLADYPVLDESGYEEKEYNAQLETLSHNQSHIAKNIENHLNILDIVLDNNFEQFTFELKSLDFLEFYNLNYKLKLDKLTLINVIEHKISFQFLEPLDANNLANSLILKAIAKTWGKDHPYTCINPDTNESVTFKLPDYCFVNPNQLPLSI